MAGKKNVKTWFRRILKVSVLLGSFGALAGACGVAGLFYYFGRELPEVIDREDFRPPQMTRVYASGGELIAELAEPGGGKRTVVPMDRIPKHVRYAFMAAEDADFMNHTGIDYLGMVRAFYYAIVYDTGLKGTSTITQQVVKNLILTPERSIERKIKEILLARELEANLTKEDILWLYLNEIYLGHGVHGVEEAAKLYFGKSVEALALEEGAVLAGITQSPERLSPHKHPERALKRRAFVLEQLWEKGFIEESEYRRADASELVVARRRDAKPHLHSAPHFAQHVRRLLIERYGKEKVYTSGLRVYTTLDLPKQRAAQRAMQLGMLDYDKRHKFFRPVRKLAPKRVEAFLTKQAEKMNSTELDAKTVYEGVVQHVSAETETVLLRIGDIEAELLLKPSARIFGSGKKAKTLKEVFSPGHVVRVRSHEGPLDAERPLVAFEPGPEVGVVLIDPKTRGVLALVGGYDFDSNQFNHATQAKRQSGSTFKPYVYAAALEKKTITPATIFNDSPQTFKLGGGKIYSPRNSDGKWRGPIRIREALGASRNVVAVKVLMDLGLDDAIAFAQKLGIESDLVRNATMVMGSSSITPLEAVNAYATFASGGLRAAPQFITRVETMTGEIEQYGERPEPAIAPEVAYLATDLMQAVTEGYISSTGQKRQGTGAVVRDLGHPVAGKTGTTNEARDAWFIGFTPYYVAGVWVGFDDNRPLGNKEYGGRVAAPIWLKMMKAAHDGLPRRAFEPPATGITTAQIDPKTGKLVRDGGFTESFLTGTAPTEYAPDGDDANTLLMNQFP